MGQRGLTQWVVWFGMGYLSLVFICGIAAPWVAPYGYDVQFRDRASASPSAQHWLGTDELGRDVLSRLIYGARVSLFIGVGVELIAILIALILGITAGYFRGRLENVIMRFTDAMFAFPDILLAILIVGISGPGLQGVVVALIVVSWPALTRLVRGMTLVLREREFVQAARASGASEVWIARRHLLPHLIRGVLAVSTVEIAGLILAESALSFIGLGVQAPHPSWGSMINTGREYIRSNPSLVFYPAFALSLTVVSLTFVGEWLQDRWSSKGR